MKKETFFLLDGNALLHRAWHALPPLTTKDGRVVNAAYGFAMVIEKMLEANKPDYMVAAWDLPGSTFRHEIDKQYKAHRKEKEQELYDQIDLVKEILQAFGIPSVVAKGYEADDVIGTLAKKAARKDLHVMIVTGDLDSLQLVDDHIRVLFFQKGISETKTYDWEAVKDRFGLVPDQLVDYKALRGDPSDNIPGVPGIGEKTATELLQKHGSLSGVFQALKQGKLDEKYAKKLAGKEKQAEQCHKLAEIVQDVKIDFRLSSAKLKIPNWDTLLELYRDLDFRTLIRKHENMTLPVTASVKRAPSKHFEVLLNVSDFSQAIKPFDRKQVAFILHKQPADLFGGVLTTVCITNGSDTLIFPHLDREALENFGRALKTIELFVVHDAKALLHLSGWESLPPVFDVMIASYLLHPGSRAHDFPSVIHNQLKSAAPELPHGFSKDADYQKLATLTGMLLKLENGMRKNLKETGLLAVFEEMETPLIFVLHRMERTGIKVDVKTLEVFSKKLDRQIQTLTKNILRISGEEFNINSPSQLAIVLFEKMQLPTKQIKKTKTGFSTAASELEKLWEAHEIIPLISEYRELTKLQSTYVEALPKLVAHDGRIHTSYNQAVTATGRLSSSDPNLQNIPIKTELGREIRKAFVAPRGRRLVSADYSQIELRLMAVIAKDKPLIEAFKAGADIHTRTASEVWEIEESEVTKEQRQAAKAINFGIMYGMGPRSLSRSTGLSMDEAKIFIEKYFQIHTAVRDYIEQTKALAHDQGYVETLFGRRRYLPEIHSGVQMLVAQAERMAVNMPLQGTASDIMKKAMLSVDGWLTRSDWDAQILLQVHDELVLETDAGMVDGVARGLKEMMEGVTNFDVPLIVDVEIGTNWGEMK